MLGHVLRWCPILLVGSLTLVACDVAVAPRGAAPTALAFVAAPAGAVSGNALTTQPVIAVLDADGRPIAGTPTTPRVVQVALDGGAGTLGGILEAEVVDGRATFDGIGIVGGGAQTLRFTLVDHPAASLAATVQVAPPSEGIRLNVGASSLIAGRVQRTLEVPVLVDLQSRGAQDLGALTVRLTWDPQKLSYVGDDPGAWRDLAGGNASVTVNTQQTATGEFRLTGYSVQPTTSSFRLRTLRFSPLLPGATPITATVTVAGTSAGAPIPIAVRHLDVRVLQ